MTSLHPAQGHCEAARFTLTTLSPLLALTSAALAVGCAPADGPPPAISLVQDFAAAEVTGSPQVQPQFPRLEWRFDGASPLPPEGESDAAVGWSALHDIRDLLVEDGLLRGTAGRVPILVAAIPEHAFPDDRLWAIELRLRISAGTKLGIETCRSDEIDKEELLQDIQDTGRLSYMIDLRPGEAIASYSLTEANATFSKMEAIGNLHQGVEVLHERESIDDLGDYRSKTSRTYVDRVLPWLEDHRDQPFFVFLHVFDPHSPFRPMPPYDRRWLDDDAIAHHEHHLEKVDGVVKVFHHLPSADQLRDAEVDADTFVTAEQAWYDGSIRAMDSEIASLLERLAELGLCDDTLIAFVADHGEEFLEHGNHWHGHSAYGELVNVPMFMTWPGRVPSGLAIDETTQSIDLMPTLLELAQLPIPESAQGASLLPLLAEPHDPASAGWNSRAVFTERKNPPGEATEGTADSFAVLADGWKLIWNVVVRDDRPEIELFDHRNDPLNRVNVTERHPQVVADLRSQLESWRDMVESRKVSSEGAGAEIDPEELAQLRALGYAN